MRYNIHRWYENKDIEEKEVPPDKLEDCERLEVVRQVIKAIDNGQNFEAIVSGPEREG